MRFGFGWFLVNENNIVVLYTIFKNSCLFNNIDISKKKCTVT